MDKNKASASKSGTNKPPVAKGAKKKVVKKQKPAGDLNVKK